MTHDQLMYRIKADIHALPILEAQDALEILDEMLRKFAWPHDGPISGTLQDCVIGLEDVKRDEEQAEAALIEPVRYEVELDAQTQIYPFLTREAA